MKLKDGLVISKEGDSYILVDSGICEPFFNGMIRLNKSALFITNLLIKGINYYDAITMLLKKFSLDKETATNYLDQIIKIYKDNKLI